jgi:hypothetical protein
MVLLNAKPMKPVVEMISTNPSFMGISNSACDVKSGDVFESNNKTTSKIIYSILLPLVLYSIISLSFFFWTVVAHAGKHAYPEFLPTISHEVLEVMIKHGMPVAHDRSNKWYKISGIPGSYTLRFNSADEIPQQAVLDIIKLCLRFYELRERREHFRILMYHESHKEWRESLFLGIGLFARIKPFFELTIGGKDK